MRYVVRRLSHNVYEIERVSGWWFWKTTYVAQAYWYEDPEGMFGTWYWVDDDKEIKDPDVRIALCEADNAWKKAQEEKVWKKK